jgi:hemoglobin-like flavoprotein
MTTSTQPSAEAAKSDAPLPVELLEESFDLVARKADVLAATFYERLFADAPQLRPLFVHTDMVAQQRMLLAALVLLRKSLRNLESIIPALQALGRRHTTYGVLPEHYGLVGAALLATMAELGGADWQPAYTTAWAAAYGLVRDIMIGASEIQDDAVRTTSAEAAA